MDGITQRLPKIKSAINLVKLILETEIAARSFENKSTKTFARESVS